MKKYFQGLFELSEETGAHPGVVKNFKRNFVVNFLDIALYFFGDSFVAAYTILPVFVSTLTDSPIVIGLVPAIFEAGWFLPQFFFAPFVQKQPRLIRIVYRLGLLERLSFFLLAAGAFLVPVLGRQVGLWVVMLLIVLKSVISGIFALPWQELIAKLIPFSHRGRFYGWANVLGKILGLAGAAVTGIILMRVSYPNNYALVFFIGFVIVVISLGLYLFVKEPENFHLKAGGEAGLDLKSAARTIIRSNASFRNFMISRAFSFLGFMAFGLMAVYGIQRYELPESYAAVFTGVLVFFTMVGYALLGVVGDRKGNKLVFVLSDLFFVLSIVIALVWQNLLGIYVVFGLMGLANAGAMIGDMNMAMEFGQEDQRPTFIGLSKTLTGPFFLLAPIIGGSIVNTYGYETMFGVSIILSVVAVLMLVFLVSEPRNQQI